VWRSEEPEEYNAYVLGEQTVKLHMPFTRFGSARVSITFADWRRWFRQVH
jgi:hypothetical protein